MSLNTPVIENRQWHRIDNTDTGWLVVPLSDCYAKIAVKIGECADGSDRGKMSLLWLGNGYQKW
jgi:hypothetical protein